MSIITEQEFQDWLELPVTKKYKDVIRKEVDKMTDMLIECSEEDLKDIQGRIKASIGILRVTYEDIHE